MRPKSDEYELVIGVQDLEKRQGLGQEEALAQAKGSATKPSLAQFKVWRALVDATAYDVRQQVTKEIEQDHEQPWPYRVIGWIRAFFTSGLLFVGLGIALIAWADHVQDDSHTAFTFVYVVLGIAITLYGTGTQAVGAMRSDLLTNGWFQGSMAGGAGLLAFLAGWAIVEKHTEMREAFDQQTKYVKVSFEIGSRDKLLAIRPDQHVLSASLEGLPVLTSSLEDQFVLLLPQPANSRRCEYPVKMEFAGRDGTQLRIDDAFHFLLGPDCANAAGDSETDKAVLVGLTPRQRAGADFDEYVAPDTVEFEQKILAVRAEDTPPDALGRNDLGLEFLE